MLFVALSVLQTLLSVLVHSSLIPSHSGTEDAIVTPTL